MTQAEQIKTLALGGFSPLEIAEKTTFNRDYVRSAISRLRRSGVPIPCFGAGRPTHASNRNVAVVRLDALHPSARRDLSAAAERRGVSVRELVEEAVIAMVEGNLIDAVLDDGGDHAAS